MVEESKVPDDYESQMQKSELIQIEYLFKKEIPRDSVVTLGPESLIIKNGTKMACIQLKGNDLLTTFINNGKRKRVVIYIEYTSLVDSVINMLYGVLE